MSVLAHPRLRSGARARRREAERAVGRRGRPHRVGTAARRRRHSLPAHRLARHAGARARPRARPSAQERSRRRSPRRCSRTSPPAGSGSPRSCSRAARRRAVPPRRGFVGGCAVLVDYPAVVIVAAVAVVVALRAPRRLGWFVLGGLPPLAALLAYNARRLRLAVPSLVSLRGAAVLRAAASRLLRHRRAEPSRPEGGADRRPGAAAVLAGARPRGGRPVAALARGAAARGRRRGGDHRRLRLSDAGYFLPYGGASPGPRFLVAALPFLALGLGPAFRRWPRTTTVFAAVSVFADDGRPDDVGAQEPERHVVSRATATATLRRPSGSGSV